MNYFIYKVVRFIGRPIYKIVFRAKYYGVDNIPSEGAVILAGNHTNNLDAAMMIGAPKRIVHMMAKKELFSSKISNYFFRSMGCISVNRSIHDENAKSEALKNAFLEKEGKWIMIVDHEIFDEIEDGVEECVSYYNENDMFTISSIIINKL